MPGPLDALKKATSLTNDPQGEWASAHPILSALAGLISPATDPHRDMGPLDVAGSALPLVGGMAGMRALKGIAAEERERRAIEQGYTKLGWHGTTAPIDFSEFKTHPTAYGEDFGIHVATVPETANASAGTVPIGRGDHYYSDNARIIPVRFRANSPLEMPDVNVWRSPHYWREKLARMNMEQRTPQDRELLDKLSELSGRTDQDYWPQVLQGNLQRGGYDSIKYPNTIEGNGEPSYLLLDPRQVKSVNAAFDPSQFGKTKDIMKSVAPLAPIAGLKSAQTKQKE